MNREEFREACVSRDEGECLVPGCQSSVSEDPEGPGDVHHIIERKLWDDGGYTPGNGASVCETHHKSAEDNIIPPQAFWLWANIDDPPIPDQFSTRHINKWGQELETPPEKRVSDISGEQLRQYIKYPSTRHLPYSHERDADDTAHQDIEFLIGMPLVATVKMDGANSSIVNDETPFRARNGSHAEGEQFDNAEEWFYQRNLHHKIPKRFQVFGEWLRAKHSIHYGCDCDEPCDDTADPLESYFQVFAIYDNHHELFLSWEMTKTLSQRWGLTTVPLAESVAGVTLQSEYNNKQKLWNDLWKMSQSVVQEGHEGIVVRSRHPFHYGQISERLGKYVRPNHIKEEEKHWSKRELVTNNLA